jgi:hypothetical protein
VNGAPFLYFKLKTDNSTTAKVLLLCVIELGWQMGGYQAIMQEKLKLHYANGNSDNL